MGKWKFCWNLHGDHSEGPVCEENVNAVRLEGKVNDCIRPALNGLLAIIS